MQIRTWFKKKSDNSGTKEYNPVQSKVKYGIKNG
jgi:hypothetical protein